MANERRLIDANALKEQWTIPSPEPYSTDAAEVLYTINEAPTVEAIEVVRCKDCKHYDRWSDGRTMNHCSKHDRLAYDDDFCSYGEKREVE